MGCDIHGHVEIKIDGQWHHHAHPRIQRSYDLFARLAGVRNRDGDKRIEPIAQPRGLPSDITFTTRFDAEVHWNSDGHSHSWVSGDELGDVIAWLDATRIKWRKDRGEKSPFVSFEQEFGYLFGNGWNSKPEGYPQVQDVRFVFWFDN